jgi:hypothetical protein
MVAQQRRVWKQRLRENHLSFMAKAEEWVELKRVKEWQ